MARSLSSVAKKALLASETGEAIHTLIKIDHDELPEPIRVTSDAVETVSNGEVFQAFPFQVTLPDESEERPPTVRLIIDNVAREIVTAARSIIASGVAADVTLEVVFESDTNTVEAGPFNFKLRNVTYDVLTVEGDLLPEDHLNEPFPGDRITPSRFPGVF